MTPSQIFHAAALCAVMSVFGCGGAKKCSTDADCAAGHACARDTGTCVANVEGTPDSGATVDGGAVDGGIEAAATEVCATAPLIEPGTLAGTLVGTRNDYAIGCTGFQNPGGDLVYRIAVPAGRRLRATVTPEKADAGVKQFDPSLYLVTTPAASCAELSNDAVKAPGCLAGSDSQDYVTPETAFWTNGTTAAAEVYVIVDSAWSPSSPSDDATHEGAFTLTTELEAPLLGDDCLAPDPMTAGETRAQQRLDTFASNYDQATPICTGGPGPDRVYSIVVPAGMQVSTKVTPTFNMDVSVAFSLNAGACISKCLDSVDNFSFGEEESFAWTNREATSKTVFIIVDSPEKVVGESFSIAVEVRAPPTGDTCDSAPSLTAGVPLAGQTTRGYSNNYETTQGARSCVAASSAGDRTYAISLPNGKRGRVAVTPVADAGMFDPSIAFIAGGAIACDEKPRVCVGGGDGTLAGEREEATYFNVTGLTQQIFAIVDSSYFPGDFSIEYTTEDPAPDDTCTTAATTLTSAPLSGQSLGGFGTDYAVGQWCSAIAKKDRVYKVSIAPGQKMTATVTPATPDAGFDPVLEVMTGAAASCETSLRECAETRNSLSKGLPESIGHVNLGQAAKDVFLIVGDGNRDSTDSTFSISVAQAAPPAGESCSSPMVIAAPGLLENQTLVGFSREYTLAVGNATCTPYRAPEVVYEIVVPAGKTLGVVATPDQNSDIAFNLIEGPASNCNDSPTCLLKTISKGAGEAVSGSYSNASGADKRVFIVVTSGVFRTAYTLKTTLN
jgi:hypothetical protein